MDTQPGDPNRNAPPPPTSRIPPVPTRRVLVWDLPTRVLHWILAGSFTSAFLIAYFVRHRDPLFPLHMLLGAVAATVVVLRFVWGLFGSRYARFGSFPLRPSAVFEYLRGLVRGRDRARVGHNPANATVAVAMFLCILGLAVTGTLMAGGSRGLRTVHQALAYGMVALVVGHVVGILVHTVRHRENIALGMFDGRKSATSAQAIASAHPVVALGFLVIVLGAAGELVHSYDTASRTVTLPGIGKLRLGRGGKSSDAATARRRRPDGRGSSEGG